MPQTKDPKPGDLVVSETRTGVWSYHLRLIDEEGFKPSGLFEKKALCGHEMGWDTRVPLDTYGRAINTITHWCSKCLEAVKEGGVNVGEAQRALLSGVQLTVQSNPVTTFGSCKSRQR